MIWAAVFPCSSLQTRSHRQNLSAPFLMQPKAKSFSDQCTATIGFGSGFSPFVIPSALPGQLFYSTQIPVGLWFLAKNKNADAKRGFRDRRKQTLFIGTRALAAKAVSITSHRYHRNPNQLFNITTTANECDNIQ